jgi:DHA2 family methylenomycin A resistance protein-like MFS transporter
VGIWAGAGSLALASGPVLGGLLIIHFGWRSIFYINVPLGLLGIWWTVRFAPDARQAKGRSVDSWGQITAILAIAALAIAITHAGSAGFANRFVIVSFILALVMIFGFVAIERGVAHPMMPLHLFHSKTFSVAAILGLIINLVFYGVLFVLSLFFQTVHGYSALQAGMAFLPTTVVIMLTNLMSGRWIGQLGARKVILIGLSLAAVGYGCLWTVMVDTPYPIIALHLIVAGIGTALTIPSLTVVTLASAKGESAGIVSGVFNAARQVGGLLGVALFGSMISNKAMAGFITGLHHTAALSAALLLLSLLAIGFYIHDLQEQPPVVNVEEVMMG